jgi:putative transposase
MFKPRQGRCQCTTPRRRIIPGTYSNLIFHVVFSTKDRVPLINEMLENELHRYITGIIHGEGAVLFKIGGTENHIHIVMKLRPRHFIPDLLKRIKANSSKWINDHHKIEGRFSWQVGYGVFSVSESQLAHIIAYVENQKTHHCHRTFEEEFVQFLEKHGIEYDSKYLWN